jgi:hypothetical protein
MLSRNVINEAYSLGFATLWCIMIPYILGFELVKQILSIALN